MSSAAHLLSLQLAGWHSDPEQGQRNEKRKKPKKPRERKTGKDRKRKRGGKKERNGQVSAVAAAAQLMFLRDRSVTPRKRIPSLLILGPGENHKNCLERHDILRHGKKEGSTHGSGVGCGFLGAL